MDLLSIRLLRESDFTEVLAIQAACYTELVPESLESLFAKQKASPETCFLAEMEGEPVGYLISVPWTSSAPPELNRLDCMSPEPPDCLYLHDVAVHPCARKAGSGRALVMHFLNLFESSDWPLACLIAAQGSSGFWRKFGFEAEKMTEILRLKLADYGDTAVFMKRRRSRTSVSLKNVN